MAYTVLLEMTAIKLVGLVRGMEHYVIRWCVLAATCAFFAPVALAEKADATVTVSGEMLQPVHFGVDAERLWFYWPEQREKLAELAVGKLKVDFARVAINCAYEREEGVTNMRAYADVIIPMMKTFRKYNPGIRFFASPRPLKEAYDKEKDRELVSALFKKGNIGMAAYPAWVGGHKRLLKREYRRTRKDEWARYLADYLNLMAKNGLDIAYLDLMNKDQSMWEGDIDNILYVIDRIPKRLDNGVTMPKIVFPSTWSPGDGLRRFLDSPSVAARRLEVLEHIDVVSTHNTPDSGRDKFNMTDLEAFARAVRAVDPGKEVWNTEMHGWVGARSPADDILNSVILWRHLAAGFSGIDTWLFFGAWKGAGHPMVYSNRQHGPETTAKYEIFKSIVNDTCGGRYMASVSTDERIAPAVLMKDGRMLVSLLNTSEGEISVNVRLPSETCMRGGVETRLWEATKGDVAPRIGHLVRCEDVQGWTFAVPAQALVHFAFDVDVGK